MKHLLLAAALTLPATLSAQSLAWVQGFPADQGTVFVPMKHHHAVDPWGNITLAGYYWGGTTNYDMDPGPGTAMLHSGGGEGIYLCRYDDQGNFLRQDTVTVPAGGYLTSLTVEDMCTDAGGNVYLTGTLDGELDFDPGPGQALANTSQKTAWVASYTAAGSLRWHHVWTGTGTSEALRLAYGSSGDLLLTGFVGSGTADLDPGAGTLTANGTDGEDGFLLHLNTADGSLLQGHLMAGYASLPEVRTFSMGNLSSGGTWAFGYTSGTVDFDPAAGQQAVATGISAAYFYIAWDAAGAMTAFYTWTGYATGTPYAALTRMSSGDYILVSALFGNALDADPGAGTTSITANGMIARYDAGMNLLQSWPVDYYPSAAFETTGEEIMVAAFLLPPGGTFDLDHTAGTNLFTLTNGVTDAVIRMDASLNYLDGWALEGIGTTPALSMQDVSLDWSGNLVMSGLSQQPLDFDPYLGQYPLPATPFYHIYLASYRDQATGFLGRVYYDGNANAVQDGGEPGLNWQFVGDTLSGGGCFTVPSGDYQLLLDTGNVVISTSLPWYQAVPAQHSLTANSFGQTVPGLDFALQPQGQVTDMRAWVTGTLVTRPDRIQQQTIYYKNMGTTSPVCDMQYRLDPLQHLISVSPPADSFVNHTLYWHIPAVNPFAERSVKILLEVDTTATDNDVLEHFLSLNPQPTDTTPFDNVDTLVVDVNTSWDPNAIYSDPKCFISTAQRSERITFTVQFQNTGSDSALRVRILDSLDAHLNWHSLQYEGSSHTVTGWSVSAQGVLQVRFDGIGLPDSTTDEPGSHGYVRFSLLPKPGLNYGDEIRAGALIFFDYNAPIATNVLNLRVEDFPVSTQPATGTQSNGSITVTSGSGATYTWSLNGGSAQGSGQFFGLPNGNYVVHVDDGDCGMDIPVALGSGVSRPDAAGAGLRVYPNPAQDHVILDFTAASLPGTCTWTLTDLTGKTLRSANCPAQGNQILDLNGLPAGVYLLHMRTAAGEQVQKLVVE